MDGKKMRWMSIKAVRDGGGNRGKEGKRRTCWGTGSATNGDGSSEQMMDEAAHVCVCVCRRQNVWTFVHERQRIPAFCACVCDSEDAGFTGAACGPCFTVSCFIEGVMEVAFVCTRRQIPDPCLTGRNRFE